MGTNILNNDLKVLILQEQMNQSVVKKIRVLNVSFDTEIKGWEVPAFRGAVIEKAGRDSILFHNHLGDSQFRYSYPLIQYKQINHKPVILCVDHGVDEIHKFFENRDWSLKISDRTLDMKIDRLQLNSFTMQVWDKKFDYSIQRWLALNQENYHKYNKLEGLAKRIEFLESILTGNILSLARGINWDIEKEVEVTIKNIRSDKPLTFKKQKVTAFDMDFSANVFLPDYIGLGKGVSLGLGMVRRKKENSKILN